MRILFASYNHLPKIGGITLTTDQLARRLVKRGHAVAVLAGLDRTSLPGMYQRARWRLRGHPGLFTDGRFPYGVFRAVDPAHVLHCVRARFRPDILIVNVGGTMEQFACSVLQAAGDVPAVLYFHDAACVPLLEREGVRPRAALAVGFHVADRIRAESAVPATTVTPLVERPAESRARDRRVVLFINPTPIKGVDIAWALAAARPDVPFVFQESWRLKKPTLRELRRRAAELRNVEIRRARRDPGRVYADARILLAPYQANEGFGRVVVEAHSLGIPTLASDIASFRSIAARGGLLVDPAAPIQRWVAALATLWDDTSAYERYAQAAREDAARKECRAEHIVARFEEAVAGILRPLPAA